MLAAAHPVDNERGTAIGIAMGVTGLGVLGMYWWTSKAINYVLKDCFPEVF